MTSTTQEISVISLGWGVQSFTMAAMVALGDLPPITAAIHADTTYESSATYEFVKKWTPWLEEHGIQLITVKAKNGGPKLVDCQAKNGQPNTEIPAFVVGEKPKGMLHRQCTNRWKIAPLRKAIRKIITSSGVRLGKTTINQWIGISLDEFQRMKDSQVRYIKNTYPLIDAGMTRDDCKKYLLDHGLDIPSKSACIFCPYRNTQEWQELQDIPGDWIKAISLDESIRNIKPGLQLFVHPSYKALSEVEFKSDPNEISRWNDECSGICGV